MDALKDGVYSTCKAKVLVCSPELGHHNGEKRKQIYLVWRGKNKSYLRIEKVISEKQMLESKILFIQSIIVIFIL